VKRQHVLLASGVALLLLLNLRQWLPRSGDTPRAPAARGASFQPDDFRLKTASAPTNREGVSRNLFAPKVVAVPVKKVELPPPPILPPPKTPEQLAEEAARAELAQFKLLGIVFRAEKGQAYIVKGEEVFMAFVGDKVGQRFVVDGITTDSVRLKDANTNVTGQIMVSGK
jgi:Tfp pilus assembly protein PilP